MWTVETLPELFLNNDATPIPTLVGPGRGLHDGTGLEPARRPTMTTERHWHPTGKLWVLSLESKTHLIIRSRFPPVEPNDNGQALDAISVLQA